MNSIAVDSHVYTFASGPNTKPRDKKKFGLTLVSAARASTFSSFCAEHDARIFKESDNLRLKSGFHICLINGYRALAYEIAMHSRGAFIQSYINNDISADFSVNDVFSETKVHLMSKWTQHGLRRLSTYQARMSGSSSKRLVHVQGSFDLALPFAAVGSFPVSIDFFGNSYHRQENRGEVAFCELYILPYNGGTIFGICGFEYLNKPALKNLVKSIVKIPKKDLATKLLQLSVCSIENIYFSPKFIDQIGESGSRYIQQYFLETLIDNPLKYRAADALARKFKVSLSGEPAKISSNIR